MLPLVLERCVTLGHTVFERDDTPFNINIVGIRTKDNSTNSFNDKLFVGWKYQGRWETRLFPITTDPGTYYREHPLNVKGTAILVPGQYRNSHKIGKHRGAYTALVQRGSVKVYRDNNKDEILDCKNPIDAGNFGINIHRASTKKTSTVVGKWSAGCQVFANSTHFDEFINICVKSKGYWGNSFSYTLIEI